MIGARASSDVVFFLNTLLWEDSQGCRLCEDRCLQTMVDFYKMVWCCCYVVVSRMLNGALCLTYSRCLLEDGGACCGNSFLAWKLPLSSGWNSLSTLLDLAQRPSYGSIFIQYVGKLVLLQSTSLNKMDCRRMTIRVACWRFSFVLFVVFRYIRLVWCLGYMSLWTYAFLCCVV
jgi:hypothetical protein